MIDYDIFRRMHSGSNGFKSGGADKMDLAAFEVDTPPDEDFLALLLAYIHGFSMQTKQWGKLNQHSISVLHTYCRSSEATC